MKHDDLLRQRIMFGSLLVGSGVAAGAIAAHAFEPRFGAPIALGVAISGGLSLALILVAAFKGVR